MRMRSISLAASSMSTRLAHRLAVGLVQQHSCTREREALALRARCQQHRGGRRGLTEADRADLGLDVLQGVVDREQRG